MQCVFPKTVHVFDRSSPGVTISDFSDQLNLAVPTLKSVSIINIIVFSILSDLLFICYRFLPLGQLWRRDSRPSTKQFSPCLQKDRDPRIIVSWGFVRRLSSLVHLHNLKQCGFWLRLKEKWTLLSWFLKLKGKLLMKRCMKMWRMVWKLWKRPEDMHQGRLNSGARNSR